jgi:hypothetical protein
LEVVVQGLVGIDAELDDRNGGVGKGVHQHRPGAVVDATAVDVRTYPGWVHNVAYLGGQLG